MTRGELLRLLSLVALLCLPALGGWLPVESLTVTPTIPDSTAPAFGHCVGVDPAGNVHVVWQSGSGVTRGVRYRRWDVENGAWDVEETISAPGRSSRVPSLAVDDSGNVHVVWWSAASDTAILYRSRDGFGGTWGEVETMATGRLGLPVVAARSPGFVGVTYNKQLGGTQLVPQFRLRQDGVWLAPETISGTSSIARGTVSLSIDDSGRAGALWLEAPAGGRRLAYRERVGGAWGSVDTLLNGDLSDTCCVVLRPDGVDAIGLRRASSTNKYLVLCRRRGGVWLDTLSLPRARAAQNPASLAIDELGRLHATWCAEVAVNQWQVWYSRSDTSGAAWSTPCSLTSGAYSRANPSTSCGPGGEVRVVWTDRQASNPPSDIRSRRFVERVVDIAAGPVVAPVGVVDSGEWVQPAAWVRNNGDSTERSVPVWLGVGERRQALTADSVLSGGSALVTGESLQMVGRGFVPLVCSTRVAGDTNRANDVLRDSVRIRVVDVAAAGWNAPGDSLADTLLVPEVVTRNAGTDHADIVAFVTIGPDYSDSTAIRLAPGRDSAVRFAPWPVVPGAHVARCSVASDHDLHPENDTLARPFFVVLRDAAVKSIESPADSVDSGVVLRPRVTVRNRGSVVESFGVRLRVGDRFVDTAAVSGLEPESSAAVEFREWTATEPGAVAVECATLLGGDIRPGNDTLAGAAFVRVRDAAARRVLRPTELISQGPVEPAALVANDGNVALGVAATLVIETGGREAYRADTSVMLAAGEEREIGFRSWEADSGGDHRAVVSVACAGDRRPDNDTAAAAFRVARVDGAALAAMPAGAINEGWVTPSVLVRNCGDDAAELRLALEITDSTGAPVYRDSTRISLPPDAEQVVVLRDWNARPGAWRLVAVAPALGDEWPGNDTVAATLAVDSIINRRWRELAPMPPGPRGRPQRAGGCAAALGDGFVALKGARTPEFYRYFAAADSWQALAGFGWRDSTVRLRSGAALGWDGGDRVYAVRGGGTREFWSYSLAGDSWSRLPDLPEFTIPVRHGTGLAFLPGDTGRVFLIKGSRTSDFLVYWVEPRQWHARRPAPGRTPGRGTALVAAGSRLWCIKGGTNEFYEYRPDRDSWVALPPVPLDTGAGPARKFRRGAAIAPVAGRWLWALKGGRSNEVWRYDSWSRKWARHDDIPPGSRRRRVGDGGALVAVGERLHALKGDGTRELWRCDSMAAPLPLSGRVSEPATGAAGRESLAAAATRAGLRISLPAGVAGAVVYDAVGRVRARVRGSAGGHEVALSERGVFFVRFDCDGDLATLKVIRP